MSPNKRRKKVLAKATVDVLLAYVAEKRLSVLPPIPVLAKQLGVGETTMSRAVQELVRKGMLSCSQGRRVQVVTSANNSEKTGSELFPGSKAEQLYSRLRENISRGRYKVGESLPKFDYLKATFHISGRVVAQVYRRFEIERLIHKSGRSWIVGPPTERHDVLTTNTTVHSRHAYAAIVLTHSFAEWASMITSNSHHSFASFLDDEFARGHVLAMTCGTRPDQHTRFFPAGPRNVGAYIQSLGDRYIGALIPSGKFPEQFRPHEQEWFHVLASTRKPVVWCDLNGYGSGIPAEMKTADSKFAAIKYDMHSATASILSSLYTLGHRKIGAPFVTGVSGKWSVRRAALFVEVAQSMGPDIQIVTERIPTEFWGTPHPSTDKVWPMPQELLTKVRSKIEHAVSAAKKGPRSNRWTPTRADMAAAAPSLMKLITHDRVTALIAPNDYYACMIYAFLLLLDMRIPDDMSLVSFDNSPFIHTYPIATVDRGQRHMAYCTAHLLLGDIPIQISKQGDVLAESLLIDRGSMARPGKQRFRPWTAHV